MLADAKINLACEIHASTIAAEMLDGDTNPADPVLTLPYTSSKAILKIRNVNTTQWLRDI